MPATRGPAAPDRPRDDRGGARPPQAGKPAQRTTSKPRAALQALHFAGLSRPVLLPAEPDLLDGLAAVLRGWTHEARPATPDDRRRGRHLTRLQRDGAEGWRLHSAFLDDALRGLGTASAVCGVVADLVQGFVAERPGCLTLHCGAVRLGRHLVALTGPARAGKSTLVARLAAEPGAAVFCDDALPILQDGLALGLGIAPRLRLPLPRNAGQALRRHVAEHPGPRDGRCAYLATPSLVPHGTRAPLASLVVLDRRSRGPARLHRLEPSRVLHHLLARNMADFASPEAALDAARRVAGSLAGFTLVYARLDEAAALLRDAFATDEAGAGAAATGPLPPTDPPRRSRRRVPPAKAWRRASDVAIRRQAEGAYLWRAGDPVLWELNAVAGAVWTLLETPSDAAGIATILGTVFPDVPPDILRRDVVHLLGAMAAEALILPA